MWQILYKWYQRYFSDPEAVILCLSLIVGLLIISLMGRMLAPVFASIVIAYLLQWLVVRLESWRVPHILSVLIIYAGFLGLLAGILALFPLLWQQLVSLFKELPHMIEQGQSFVLLLPEHYPDYLSVAQVKQMLIDAKVELGKFGQAVLSFSLASIPSLIIVSVYLVLVPLLVYFFLMDRDEILNWLKGYMPERRQLLTRVWDDVHEQIGNYIRGKVLEVIIVWIVCFIVFALMGLPYASLLAALVGLSVIIPYIGAVLVTIPVLIIAFLQWGATAYFGWFTMAYAIIIILDANILVPVLFSEVVKLHPVAIILAVLVFGGLWGFWGVFFAIPLASLVKAILQAWPRHKTVLK